MFKRWQGIIGVAAGGSLVVFAGSLLVRARDQRRFVEVLTSTSQQLRARVDRPSVDSLNAWLDTDRNRSRALSLALNDRSQVGLQAWEVLLAARDAIASREIVRCIREAERQGILPWNEGGAYDYIWALYVASTPEAKAILWDLILDPKQRFDVCRSATLKIDVMGGEEDLQNLARAVRLRIASDPGYATIARKVAERILRADVADKWDGDAAFLKWLDRHYPAEGASRPTASQPTPLNAAATRGRRSVGRLLRSRANG